MTTTAKTIYTTIGPVRGCCGHRHRTLEAAERCLAADQAGCRRQRGYSDRVLVHSDEDGFLVTDDGEPYHPYGRTSRAARVSDIGRRL